VQNCEENCGYFRRLIIFTLKNSRPPFCNIFPFVPPGKKKKKKKKKAKNKNSRAALN
jgi:hypothetical protein